MPTGWSGGSSSKASKSTSPPMAMRRRLAGEGLGVLGQLETGLLLDGRQALLDVEHPAAERLDVVGERGEPAVLEPQAERDRGVVGQPGHDVVALLGAVDLVEVEVVDARGRLDLEATVVEAHRDRGAVEVLEASWRACVGLVGLPVELVVAAAVVVASR